MTSHERFELLKEKYHYDEDAAEEKIDFLQERCTHVMGALAGKPLILEEWQKKVM